MSESNNDDIEWNAFLNHRDALNRQGAEQLAAFDKTLLLLATGALSLSIVFAEKMINDEPISPNLLAVSWGFFAASILVNLFSYVTSWLDTVHEIKFMDKNHDGDWRARHDNFPRTLTIGLNFFAGILFVVGVILVLRFAYINML